MLGSGLHFNTPGIVRVEKTFSAATVPGFDWNLVDAAYSTQNVIIELPSTGPSLIPFLCFVTGTNVDGNAAAFLYVKYFSNGVVAPSALYSIPLLGAITNVFSSYPLEKSFLNNAATVWPEVGARGIPSGICIAADQPFSSGDSLTVTLWCVQSGLNY